MEDTADSSILDLFGKKSKDDKRDAINSNQNSDSAKNKINKPIVSVPTQDTIYNTNNTFIGKSIIFNHTIIVGQKPRTGTDKDKSRIKKALRSYGFEVETFDDYTFEKITETLQKYSHMDHSENDCFVVVIMSHGLSGQIWARDMSYPLERLWSPFLGENCRTLINKPKLFFIQACRGEKLETPVQYESDYRTMSRSVSEVDSREPVTYTIPNTADLLIFYSTFEGHYSWRNPLNGAWFIQVLSEVLEESARNVKPQELYSLLTTVNRRVAYEYQSNVPNKLQFDEMKEMPSFVSTLTKMFFITPKNK